MKIKLKPLNTRKERILFGFKIVIILSVISFFVYLNIIKFVEPEMEMLPGDMRDEPILIATTD